MLNKKHLITLIATLLFSSQAWAATVNVSQTITPTAGIAIAGTGALTAGTGAVTLNITPSNAANFVITVAGTFALTHTNAVDTAALTVDIDGTAIPTSGSSFTNNAPTNGGTDAHILNLTSGSTAASLAGTYSTTLTVTVAAN